MSNKNGVLPFQMAALYGNFKVSVTLAPNIEPSHDLNIKSKTRSQLFANDEFIHEQSINNLLQSSNSPDRHDSQNYLDPIYQSMPIRMEPDKKDVENMLSEFLKKDGNQTDREVKEKLQMFSDEVKRR